MIRIVAVLGNIAILGFVIYQIAQHGFQGGDYLILGLCILSPLANLLALLLHSNSWITLYFRRKALEEQSKISKLAPKT